MNARNDIEKRIEKERQKISDLKTEISRIESFILGLQEALKIIPKDGETKSSRMRRGTIRAGSEIAKIQELIRQEGKPLHIGEIVVGLGKPDTKPNRMSISGSLGRYVRRGEVFNRPGPNLFSLVDMAVPSKEELPPDFGTEEVRK